MSWGYLRGVTHLDLGRQYESLPYAGMLFFAAVFGAHFHVISLPIGVLAGVALLLLETTVSVTSQGLSVVKRLGRIPLRRDHWAKDQILGASLQEHRDVTTYTSWSQRNTVRAHSFILTLRVDLGKNGVEDLEVYEFAKRADGKQVVDALKSLHISVA